MFWSGGGGFGQAMLYTVALQSHEGAGWSGVALGDNCQSQHLMNCNILVHWKQHNMQQCMKMRNSNTQLDINQLQYALHRTLYQTVRNCTRSAPLKNPRETSQTDGGGNGRQQIRSQQKLARPWLDLIDPGKSSSFIKFVQWTNYTS